MKRTATWLALHSIWCIRSYGLTSQRCECLGVSIKSQKQATPAMTVAMPSRMKIWLCQCRFVSFRRSADSPISIPRSQQCRPSSRSARSWSVIAWQKLITPYVTYAVRKQTAKCSCDGACCEEDRNACLTLVWHVPLRDELLKRNVSLCCMIYKTKNLLPELHLGRNQLCSNYR